MPVLPLFMAMKLSALFILMNLLGDIFKKVPNLWYFHSEKLSFGSESPFA
jgi:hypothetical protein